jgi:hypothetical protein
VSPGQQSKSYPQDLIFWLYNTQASVSKIFLGFYGRTGQISFFQVQSLDNAAEVRRMTAILD